ncbi:hypothetical protein K432DRAFT_211650 [Lepidopterella palustris CBS 459.81]|uniref:Infection structure specific protein n=1 Tax=Lepidopterella palustris CBS 459.81 TaxID=1314670 RepID=A0A8E2DYV8_9PEZI|nr:hypothetical protein K432DRAFT_211650 [Lepidopterella palustris CBS 459.81]
MFSKTLLSFLAASGLAIAQEAVFYEEIKIRQVVSTAAAAATTFAAYSDPCIPPASLLTPPVTNSQPAAPTDVWSYLTALTNPCAVPTYPASISAELSSYASAAKSWASVNGPALSSWEAALSSFEKNAPSSCGFGQTPSIVTGVPTTIAGVTIATSGLGVCTTATTAKSSAAAASLSTATSSSAATKLSSGPNAIVGNQVLTVFFLLSAASLAVALAL